MTTLVVAGDADILPPAHAVEVFGDPPGPDALRDGQRSALSAAVIPFLDEP